MYRDTGENDEKNEHGAHFSAPVVTCRSPRGLVRRLRELNRTSPLSTLNTRTMS